MNKEKIKSILTGKITIGVISGLICLGIGYNIGSTNTNGSPIDQSQQVQTQTENSTNNKTGPVSVKQEQNNITQMELNMFSTVSRGDGGSYNIGIEGIRFTEQRNKFNSNAAKHVLFLDYTYENTGCAQDLFIGNYNLKVMDEDVI